MLFALILASSFGYSIALFLLWRYTTDTSKHTPGTRSSIIILSLIGVIFHSVELTIRIINTSKIPTDFTFTNLTLGQLISAVAVFAALLFILISMVRATLNLGLAILPATILGLLAGYWLNPGPEINAITHPSFQWHLILSMITFGLLSLAFAQSLLIIIQDNQLRHHQTAQKSVSFISLPALQSMEAMLFQLITLGFIILSLTLGFGVYINAEQHGSFFIFNHHIVLTLLTWLGYAILLSGRYFAGWRGRQASIYTVICYSLFLLGYFGARFVRELIINA